MNTIIPSYYKDFRCTASKCSDCCCIGWEIDIDPDTLEKYKKTDLETNLNIMEHIDTSGDEPHFILREDGRCPFLDEENLCEIYRSLGEEALCQICSLHPRFINNYGGRIEYGLDLCCEEAARIILTQKHNTIYRQESTEPDMEDPFLNTLSTCREKVFSYIGTDDISLDEILKNLLIYGETLDDFIFDSDYDAMILAEIPNRLQPDGNSVFAEKEFFARCLSFLRTLTPLSVSWHNFLADVEHDLDKIYPLQSKFTQKYPEFNRQATHLLSHYIYHYFLTALWEDEVYSKLFFAAFMVCMIRLFDTALYYYQNSFSLHDQIALCCQFSKEIEYCTENLESVLDFAYNC